jgi:hypothetical protein
MKLVFNLLMVVVMFAAIKAYAEPQDLTMQDAPVYVAVGYNALGDRILLTRNLCAGDAAARDHMHLYKIVDAHGNLLAGGCWQWVPELHLTYVRFFDMNGGGWGQWPKSAFHKPIYLKGQ